jgi:hypothetical protein
VGEIQASLDRPRITEVDPAGDPRWDAFVVGHPDGSVYHHSAWFAALEKESGISTFGLAYEDADRCLRGVLPLLATRGLPFFRGGQLTGRRLASLPRTPVAGPLALGRDVTAALVAAAVERVRGEKGAALQLKVQGNDLDGVVEGLAGAPWSPTYVLDLPARPEQLRFGNARNHGRITWAIGKAQKLGVRVRRAESEGDLRDWYRLYLETMRWHGMPPRPYALFAALWTLVRPRGLMELLLAEQDGRRLLAGSIFLHAGPTAIYAFNGRRRADLGLRPNDVIMWHAIHRACERGCTRLDLGEAREGDHGLIDFKRKWGAQERWLYRYYFPPSRRRERFASGVSDSRLAAAAWRRVPLDATALMSRVVYRYL